MLGGLLGLDWQGNDYEGAYWRGNDKVDRFVQWRKIILVGSEEGEVYPREGVIPTAGRGGRF